ncbi:uncharacterized protein EV422DRAFT_416045 [Fimicolochytrium jonesii]|uniref:uncharacterized protein n=1 Tax=Fimicolochytrium jonesii TaxID=1396493 RepID=UPI0022FEEE07|nr:uncharacterized protein EV422DRAFT_416045 [Fimicolochytrium jonesii]KAI8822065.1 hypothetical protein EV422DRAFT_416045 [Fimicolochytrium jonesii]
MCAQEPVSRKKLLTCPSYSKLRAKGNRVVGAHGIENYFPNTIINILKAECWQNLLRRIGFEMMCDLLLNTTMFLCMPNGCVVQLTGIPLTDQSVSLAVDEIALVGGLPKTKSKRQIGDNNADEGPSKKIRNQAIRGIDSLRAGKPTVGAVADPNNVKAPGPQTSNSGPSCSILIARRKIFSVRGQRNATGGFLFGLPKFPSFSKTRLLADIFPNQFGSRNAFRARNGKEAGDYGGKDLPVRCAETRM